MRVGMLGRIETISKGMVLAGGAVGAGVAWENAMGAVRAMEAARRSIALRRFGYNVERSGTMGRMLEQFPC